MSNKAITVVRAPVDGMVTAVNAKPGPQVQRDHDVLRLLLAGSRLLARFPAPSKVVGLKRQLAAIALFGLVGGFVGLAAPQFVQYAIDSAVLNQDAGSLLAVAVGFAMLLLFGVGVSMLQSFSVLHLTTSMLFPFRQNLFRHSLFLPTAHFERRSVGDTLSRLDSYEEIQETVTVDAIESLIQGLFGAAVAVLLFL